MARRFLKGLHSLGYEPKQAFEFNPATGYTPKEGDLVKLTATPGEVTPAATGDYIHGRVEVVYAPLQGKVRLTVELFGQRAMPATASAVIAAGSPVVAAGNNKLRAFVAGTDRADAVVGFALTNATGDNDEFEVVVR
jgi:hypothetical protein